MLIETGALATAFPEDVVAACAAVPPMSLTKKAKTLRSGAEAVLAAKELARDERPITVRVKADDLYHLLDLLDPPP